MHRFLPHDAQAALEPSNAARHVGYITTAGSPRNCFVRGLDVRLPHDEHHLCGPLCGLPGRLSKRGRPVRPTGAMRRTTIAQLRAFSPFGRSQAETEAALRQRRPWVLFWSGQITEVTERYALWRAHRHRPRYKIFVTRGPPPTTNATCLGCCEGSPPPSASFDPHTMGAMMASSDFCAVPPGQDDGDSDRYIAAVLHGCVPVFLVTDEPLPLEEAIPWRRFSLTVRTRDIPTLHTTLAAVSQAALREMRRRMQDAWPSLLWSRAPYTPLLDEDGSSRAHDAFGTLMSVLRARLAAPFVPLGAPPDPAIVTPPAIAAKQGNRERWEMAFAERLPPAHLMSEHARHELEAAFESRPPASWPCAAAA